MVCMPFSLAVGRLKEEEEEEEEEKGEAGENCGLADFHI